MEYSIYISVYMLDLGCGIVAPVGRAHGLYQLKLASVFRKSQGIPELYAHYYQSLYGALCTHMSVDVELNDAKAQSCALESKRKRGYLGWNSAKEG